MSPQATKTFERFHMETHNAPLGQAVPRIFVERKDTCVNCGICVQACVYGVHNRMPADQDPTRVAEPDHAKCVSCHRCVNECPKEALELRPHPEFLALGDDYYTPENIRVLRREAETGRVPVSGQGYRGPFAGPGFDGIWTDMSEIVRPTRDGIHGRESISTEIELGRKPLRLRFDGLKLAENPPDTYRISLPLFLSAPPGVATSPEFNALLARSARDAGTFALLPWYDLPEKWLPQTGVRVTGRESDEELKTLKRCPVLEIEDSQDALKTLQRLKAANSHWLVSIRLPLSSQAPARAAELARGGAEILHCFADFHGRSFDPGDRPPFVTDSLRAVDDVLVRSGLRDSVSLLVSGGIAMAEHLPKSMICGADAVGIDQAMLFALGARKPATDSIPLLPVDQKLGVQRLKNLLGAWRDQLLEVLGAMGMREARRLQGETGRAMFHKDLEAEFREALKAPPTPSRPLTLAGEGRGEGAPHPTPLPEGERVNGASRIPETVRVEPAPSEIWRKIPKYKVQYTKDCIDCGLCMLACPYDAHQREPGHLKMRTPDSYACIGTVCEQRHPAPTDGRIAQGYCVPQCPTDAIRIEKNPEWETLGDPRWSADLLFSTWYQAENGRIPKHGDWEYRKGESKGGFDLLDFRFKKEESSASEDALRAIDTSIDLNRRAFGPRRSIPVPWYGGGMSYGSVGLPTMLSRARAALVWDTYTSTGEGGYPPKLLLYKDYIITQVATGMFGVREETMAASNFVEVKYAQGAKPGLGGHLLSDKNTQTVADLRETNAGISLFSPFPFHSVYSVEDHRKHVDWIHATADAVRLDLEDVKSKAECDVLVSAKVSTPADIDMVAVGCYYGGVNIIHMDGSYGGTGAAPDIAKKNIAMPIEYAIPKVHRFLLAEGIRDEIVLIASGGLRSAHDIAKAIALGADGVVLGTADLVAVNCTRCGNCESGRGCQHGIATTDRSLTKLWTHDWGAQRIINLYYSYRMELALILWRLGLKSVRELRGRVDLLTYSG